MIMSSFARILRASLEKTSGIQKIRSKISKKARDKSLEIICSQPQKNLHSAIDKDAASLMS